MLVLLCCWAALRTRYAVVAVIGPLSVIYFPSYSRAIFVSREFQLG